MVSSRRRFADLGLRSALALAVAGCVDAEPAIVQHAKARRVVADLRLAFKKAADASNLAVLADTDEASVAFAAEAEAAKKVVHERLDELTPLLDRSGYEPERAALAAFAERLAAYETMDRTVLELAVQNTNLKAQRLAFGAARESATAFKVALEASSKATAATDSCEVARATAAAIIAVREIQVLQMQHIAEPSDPAMDRMEEQMNALAGGARTEVEKLASLVEGDAKKELSSATAALDRFDATHREIVGLSRKNSNVRSSMLSLGEKRTLASACESSLEALSNALAERTPAATR